MLFWTYQNALSSLHFCNRDIYYFNLQIDITLTPQKRLYFEEKETYLKKENDCVLAQIQKYRNKYI